MRGSDPDAALYWLARMLTGGEDPLYIARRLVRFASEDIGLADPTALMMANEAMNTYRFLGSPEGELAIAHAVVRQNQMRFMRALRRPCVARKKQGHWRRPNIS